MLIEIICNFMKEELSYHNFYLKFQDLKEKTNKYISDSCDLSDDNYISASYQFQKNFDFKDDEGDNKLRWYTYLLNFLNQISKAASIDRANFNEICKIEKLWNKFFHGLGRRFTINDGVLLLKRPILGMKDIISQFSKSEEGIRSIDVYSYMFYFDRDANFPGVNLNIFTVYCHTDGDTNVSLKGVKGENIRVKRASNGTWDNPNGQHGRPGNPGKPGGSFRIECKKVFGKGKLTIDVSGGDGGVGQNGGNGFDGKDGDMASITEIDKRNESYLISRKALTFDEKDERGKIMHVLKMFGTFNGQILEKYKALGSPGEKGGDAGKAGRGGKGGYPGSIKITWQGLNFEKIENLGKEYNGRHGTPGRGGKLGKSWYGEYVNEILFPSWRKEGSEFDREYALNIVDIHSLFIKTKT